MSYLEAYKEAIANHYTGHTLSPWRIEVLALVLASASRVTLRDLNEYHGRYGLLAKTLVREGYLVTRTSPHINCWGENAKYYMLADIML